MLCARQRGAVARSFASLDYAGILVGPDGNGFFG
jgi:hypothetical protein